MRWALGESWPNADALQHIVQATGGEVTLNAMHKRRLAFLASQTPARVRGRSVESMAARSDGRINPAASPRIAELLPTPDAGSSGASSGPEGEQRDSRRDGMEARAADRHGPDRAA